MKNQSPTTWDDLRVLLALHRHQSLLAAGAALGLSTSTVARRIEALEQSLGRALVHRSSAGTTVEPDAMELVELAEQFELGLGGIKRDDRPDEKAHALTGTIRVSMGEGFVKPVTAVLSQLRSAHPGLHIEVAVESRFTDVGRREVDVALRVGRSSSAVVVEKGVGQLTFGLYASHGYVEQRLHGRHLRVQDFASHDFVGQDLATGRQDASNLWLASRGATRFVFRSGSDLARQEATEQGQGICLLPDAMAHAVPGLVRLEVDAPLPSCPVYLAYHRDRRNVPGVRAVIDALGVALADGLQPLAEKAKAANPAAQS
jgi:DNA-binding transcriptional LysR family regulator